MDDKISLAVKNANEISSKASELATHLQEISLTTSSIQSSAADPLIYNVTIFVLACFVGYYVVWKVTPSLHTPLMSITNAISGIIIIGALVAASPIKFGVSSVLGLIAIFVAAINIFGGFVVTERMLLMFKKK